MEIATSIVLILGALLAGAVSPGPSFVLVARIAMISSRADGFAAATGMGVGGALFSLLALFGLQAVLTNVPTLYVLLKIFGGLYLLWLALRIWKTSNQKLALPMNSVNQPNQCRQSFMLALITQISNPKAAIIYGGIFAALLPKEIPALMFYLLPPLVFLVETGWYLLVTLVLTSKSPQAVYLKSQQLFDRVTASVLAAIGLGLILDIKTK